MVSLRKSACGLFLSIIFMWSTVIEYHWNILTDFLVNWNTYWFVFYLANFYLFVCGALYIASKSLHLYFSSLLFFFFK